MKYMWTCPACGYTYESSSRSIEDQTTHRHGSRAVFMKRDYRAEGVQIDRFALRVGGTRAARTDPLPPEEASRVNKERMS